MKATLFVDVPCDLLQEIRLIQAISESSHTVVIPEALSDRFTLLRDELGMQYEIGDKGDLRLSHYIKLSHVEPQSCFGSLSRPLIFPASMVERCGALWADHRPHRFTFAGLITPTREQVIGDWVESNFGIKPPKLTLKDPFNFLPNRLRALLSMKPRQIYRRSGDLVVWSSNRGRLFPGKSWDHKYYEILAQSQFVLCPSGDCVWSYRFFEAILCGAIPIVEKSCPAISGFEFANLQQEARTLVWRQEAAESNLSLLKKKFTFLPGEVDEEVANSLK